MSCTVQEFIKRIRNCKTHAEEQQEVQKEMAVIKDAFRKNDRYKARAMAKLLFINMMGRDTDFGQMTCFDLMSSQSFVEKRIGYLGLTQLFHERSELLISSTNKILDDLKKLGRFETSLALGVIGEVCTEDMARTLAPEVFKIALNNGDTFLQKKALMASCRLIRKLPDLIADIGPKVQNILFPSNDSGVLLGALSLLDSIFCVNEQYIEKLMSALPLVAQIGKYQLEKRTDINQFIMVGVLRLFRMFGKAANRTSLQLIRGRISVICDSLQRNDKPDQISLEVIRTIIAIEGNESLHASALGLMVKFLSAKDANSKYLALCMIEGMSRLQETSELIKQKDLVLHCLYEKDILIKRMAINILTLITTRDSVEEVFKNLLQLLLSETDEEFTSELAQKMCFIINCNAVSRRWQLDNTLNVMELACLPLRDPSIQNLLHVIEATPELQKYALYRSFRAVCEKSDASEGLSFLFLYLLGEFGHHLGAGDLGLSQAHVLNLTENILFKHGVSDVLKAAGLNTYLKLSHKFTDRARLTQLIEAFDQSPSYQVQKRSCEYQKFSDPAFSSFLKDVIKQIPPPKHLIPRLHGLPVGSVTFDLLKTIPDKALKVYTHRHREASSFVERNQRKQHSRTIQMPATTSVTPTQPTAKQQLVDPFDIFDQPPKKTQPEPTVLLPQQKKQVDLFAGLLDSPPVQTNPPQPPKQSFDSSIFDLVGGSSPAGTSVSVGGMGIVGMGTAGSTLGGMNFGMGMGMGMGVGMQPTIPTPTVQPPSTPKPDPLDFLDLLGGMSGTAKPTGFTAFESKDLLIKFQTKVEGSSMTVLATYTSLRDEPIQSLNLQVATQPHLQLGLGPIEANFLRPRGSTRQELRLMNTQPLQRAVVLRIKVGYSTLSGPLESEKIVEFPTGF